MGRSANRVGWAGMLAGVLIGALTVSVAGLFAAHFVKSPQQLAAETAAPGPTVLTAPVERRVLRDTVVLRGSVGAARTFEVTPTASNGSLPVVTRVGVHIGDTVAAGTVLLEVAGRPLFALPGSLPVYRDLRPGGHGDDVAQLQRALKALGYDPREANGTFGPGTKRALTALYARAGYEPPTTGDDAALAAVDEQIRAAQRALAAAQSELDRLLATPPTPDGPDPVVAARLAVTYATQDLARARALRADLGAHAGVLLPGAEVVFLPAFPARVEALKAVVGRPVEAPLITVSSGALVVRCRLNPAQRPWLSAGMRVEFFSDLLRRRATGRIGSIVASAPDPGTGIAQFELVAIATDQPLDPTWAAQDVEVTVEAAATPGEVLVVPISALYSRADSQVEVLVITSDEAVRQVVVALGLSGDGFVAVTSATGELRPGDTVQVGALGYATAPVPAPTDTR